MEIAGEVLRRFHAAVVKRDLTVARAWPETAHVETTFRQAGT